jgi:hypothetical protein
MSKKGKKNVEEVVEVAVKKEISPDAPTTNVMDDLSKKMAFKKFSWRGKDINQCLDMKIPEFA